MRYKKAFQLFLMLMAFWILFTMNFSPMNLILGTVISIWISIFSRGIFYDEEGFSVRLPNIGVLLKYFLRLVYEIYKASFLQIIRIVKMDNQPMIVEVELDVNDPLIITMIANSITLTPGTITVDVDKNKLYVLSVRDDGAGGDQICQEIKNTFEAYFIGEKKGH